MKIIEKVLNLVYPENYTCIVCDDDVFDGDEKCLCKECKKNIAFLNQKVCKRCGQPVNSMADYCERCKRTKMTITKNRSAFYYQNEIIKLITNFKFKNAKYLYKPFAKILHELYIEQNFNCDIITFVPMHEINQKLPVEKRGVFIKYRGQVCVEL